MPTKRISRILISVTSGQVIFVTSPALYVNGQNLNSLFYASSVTYMNGMASCRVFIDTAS